MAAGNRVNGSRSLSQLLRRTNWSRRQRLAFLITAVVAVVATTAAFAVISTGYHTEKVSSSTSTVWVTNNSDSLVGRVNMQVDELNSSFAGSSAFDVLQQNDQVLELDYAKHSLGFVDDALAATSGRVPLPARAEVTLGRGAISIVDPDSGKWWLGNQDSLSSFDAKSTPATLAIGRFAVAVVSQDGEIFGVRPGSSSLWKASLNQDGSVMATAGSGTALTAPAKLPGGVALSGATATYSPVSMTTVGDHPVMLDVAAKTVVTADRRIPLSDVDGAVLQQPGPDSADVLLATKSNLWRIPLDGSPVTSVVAGNGALPAAPVQVGSCSYGAWASATAPLLVEQCGSGPVKHFGVSGKGSDPVFRVNKSAVVLNDRAFGASFLVNDDGTVTTVDNWGKVKPDQNTNDQTTDKNNQSQSDANTTAATKVDCSKQGPDRPVAKPAHYTIRAGRSTILPLMENVTPGNCSADEISALTALPAADGAARPVNFGQDIQVTIPAGVTGTLPDITYTVDDGVDRPTTSTLALTIAPATTKGVLKQLRSSLVPVQQGGTVTYNVLPDWTSTAHDDIYLKDAKVEGSDSVSFTPDGNITFTDAGTSGTQTKSVSFTISDGINDAKGTLKINVVQDNKELTAAAVYAASTAHVPTTVYPLKSVLSTTDQTLTLGTVTPRSGGPKATATINADGTGVTLSGTAAGTYAFTYLAVAGAKKSTGVIRFDVTAVPAKPEAPIATTDTVYLPDGSPVRLDPTANDVDPMGIGLAVAQVVPDSQGILGATVDGMQTLTIAARGTLTAPTSLHYLVSNGVGTTQGEIRVIPVPPLSTPPVPLAQNISMKVRAGDALTIPISRYAADPRGEALTVALVQGSSTSTPDTLFVSQTEIRYLAPSVAPAATIKFSYTVTNTDGDSSNPADVTLTVVPLGGDSPPNTPPAVLGRVFAGQKVTLALPIDGIDPDGDWVTLIDATSENHLGLPTISAAGDNDLTYTALPGSGVDKVDYTVTDEFGQSASGVATILVVAKPAVLQPPIAPNVTASLRPGKAVAVHILKQVSGNDIKFTATPFIAPAGWTVRVDGDALIVQADGHLAGEITSIQYNVQDGRGLQASGTVTVTVSTDAALPPPSASDIFATKENVTDNVNARVSVAASIVNNTGPVADLTLTVAAPGAVTGARQLTIPLTAARQVLTYILTDKNGLTGRAFVVVPPKKQLVVLPDQPPVPTTRPTTTAPTTTNATPTTTSAVPNTQADQPPSPLSVNVLTVNAGQTITQSISSFVSVPPGKTAVIPEGASLTGSAQGHGSRVDAGTFSYTANATGSGSDVLTIPVQEGNSATVQISVAIEVVPSMPTVSNYSTTAGAGDPPIAIPLTGLLNPLNYPGASQLHFAASGAANGFSVMVNGSTLNVTVDASVHAQTQLPIKITVTDSQGRSATGTVTVTATAKSMFRIADVPSQSGQVGKPTSVTVLQTGSFTDPIGKGLSVVPGSVKVSGAGSASGSGSTITVTPSKVGSIRVLYVVQDGSGDPTRTLPGAFSLTVKDVPTQPKAVKANQLNSTSLTVSWTASKDNGGGQVTYTVTLNGGGATGCAATTNTSCVASGLTPGKSYTFTVTPANSVGPGPVSAPSAAGTPDQDPDPPAAPGASWISAGQIAVTYAVPHGAYSPVSSATILTLSGNEVVRSASVSTSGSSYTAGSLDPSKIYKFELSVVNGTGHAIMSPASKPIAASAAATAPAPTATFVFKSSSERYIDIVWAPQNGTGEKVTYTAQVVSGATTTVDVMSDSEARIADPGDGAYSIVVTASNSHGSQQSKPVSTKAFSSPALKSFNDDTPAHDDGHVYLNWDAANASNGMSIVYTVSDTTTSASENVQQLSAQYSGFDMSQNQSYNFTLIACYAYVPGGYDSTVTCSQTKSLTAKPYLKLSPPDGQNGTATASGVAFTWNNPPATNLHARAQWSEDGSSWTDGISHEIDRGCGQPVTMYIRSIDDLEVKPTSTDAPITLTGTAQGCPPTQWAWQDSFDTCPQDQFSTSYYQNGSPPTCKDPHFAPAPTTSWIYANHGVLVNCFVQPGSGWKYPYWFHMISGDRTGYYVAGSTSSTFANPPANMPHC